MRKFLLLIALQATCGARDSLKAPMMGSKASLTALDTVPTIQFTLRNLPDTACAKVGRQWNCQNSLGGRFTVSGSLLLEPWSISSSGVLDTLKHDSVGQGVWRSESTGRWTWRTKRHGDVDMGDLLDKIDSVLGDLHR